MPKEFLLIPQGWYHWKILEDLKLFRIAVHLETSNQPITNGCSYLKQQSAIVRTLVLFLIPLKMCKI